MPLLKAPSWGANSGSSVDPPFDGASPAWTRAVTLAACRAPTLASSTAISADSGAGSASRSKRSGVRSKVDPFCLTGSAS